MHYAHNLEISNSHNFAYYSHRFYLCITAKSMPHFISKALQTANNYMLPTSQVAANLNMYYMCSVCAWCLKLTVIIG